MPRFFVQRFWFQYVWCGGWDSRAPEHYHLSSTPGYRSVHADLETFVLNEEGVNIYSSQVKQQSHAKSQFFEVSQYVLEQSAVVYFIKKISMLVLL